jgi:hypothetical protein
MACAASLDKLKEFSSYAIEGFTSGDTVVVGSGPLGLLHVAKADMMGAGQIIATDLSEERIGRVRSSRTGVAPTWCCTWRTHRGRSSRASRCSSGAG